MGLFSKKKVEEKQELPPLKFPEFSKFKEEPHFESVNPSDQGIIKRTIVPPPNLMIPIRKPVQPKSEDMMMPMPEERPRQIERPRPSEFSPPKRDRTLFVKIDKYKDVMAKMDTIREKIAESEKVLQRLQQIRGQEDHELKMWQEDLNRVKDTLVAVDRALFE